MSRLDRRSLLKRAAALAGGARAYRFLQDAPAAQVSTQAPSILIRGGRVVSMDRAIGDLDGGDVLIEQGAISAVGRNLRAPNAQVVDASSKLVLPGFVDGHRHAWMTQIRAFMVPAPFFDIVVKTMEPLVGVDRKRLRAVVQDSYEYLIQKANLPANV